MKKKGLFLVPLEKQQFDLFYCDGNEHHKLYSDSFANELIKILETDDEAIKYEISTLETDPINFKTCSFKEAEYTFLNNIEIARNIKSLNNTLGLLLETELSQIELSQKERFSYDDMKVYERAITKQKKIYKEFGSAFQRTMGLTMFYADLICPLFEKPRLTLYIDETILDNAYQESYSVNNLKELGSVLQLTKYYYFDSAANYLRFLLFQLINLNPNICLCQNCVQLFLAKTKKHTLYCSRIMPYYNKKCSVIGPRRFAALQSRFFGYGDYNKAVEQNYRRAKRTEEGYAKNARLEWNDYYSWLERARKAKKQWQIQKISDDDFMQIIHELD